MRTIRMCHQCHCFPGGADHARQGNIPLCTIVLVEYCNCLRCPSPRLSKRVAPPALPRKQNVSRVHTSSTLIQRTTKLPTPTQPLLSASWCALQQRDLLW